MPYLGRNAGNLYGALGFGAVNSKLTLTTIYLQNALGQAVEAAAVLPAMEPLLGATQTSYGPLAAALGGGEDFAHPFAMSSSWYRRARAAACVLAKL